MNGANNMANRRLVEARALKRRATALRNRGEFTRSLGTLDAAIRVLETPDPDQEESATEVLEVIAEIADTYGMKGGVFRRIPDLDAALVAYTIGAEIEVSKGLTSTYNRSNIIALSITAKETKPTDPTIRKQLASTIQTLEADTAGPRSDEWWAWADLAQYHLLYGEPEKARESHRKGLSKTGATAEEIKRHGLILEELAGRTANSAPGISASIRAAIEELPL
jgi:hypothetical protein